MHPTQSIQRLNISRGIRTPLLSRPRFRPAFALLCLVAMLAFGGFPLHAQFDSGSVLGTVRDASGAVVANAQVTLVSVSKGGHGREADWAIRGLRVS